MIKMYPDDWKHRYKIDYLRTLINRQRMKEDKRFVSADEINAMVKDKMKEIGTKVPMEAIQALINEIHDKNQKKNEKNGI